jgi:hypothetical protein
MQAALDPSGRFAVLGACTMKEGVGKGGKVMGGGQRLNWTPCHPAARPLGPYEHVICNPRVHVTTGYRLC